ARGGTDIFIVQLNAAGDFIWATRMGGTGADAGTAITSGRTGAIYTTGYFSGQADFDTGSGTATISAYGGTDIFVHKLQRCTPAYASLTESGCDSVTINGQTYTQSGVYTQTFTGHAGCDSILTINLTIHHGVAVTLPQTACDSFTFFGHTYHTNGMYAV